MSGQDLIVFEEGDGTELAPEFHPVVQAGLTGDLSQGVGGGFAVVSIRAGRFRIKYQGNEIPITDEKGDPVASIEAVILKANPYITKQYYENAYQEGDKSAPVCFSLDGAKPDEASPNKQHHNCAGCPKNAFGSRITPAGKKAKACQDNRKLAVVPTMDLRNETFGGPMLFRVPPSALKDLAMFGDAWKAKGYPYNSISVRIGMDIAASFPKPTFRAVRPLTSDEATVVLELAGSDAVEKILADFDAPAIAEAAPETEFEQPQPAAAAPPPPRPPPPLKPAPVASPKGGTFGAKPAAPKPADPAVVATVPAKTATFGGKPAAAPPAPPAAKAKAKAKAAVAPATAPPAQGDDLQDDITKILADLNATAAAGGEDAEAE